MKSDIKNSSFCTTVRILMILLLLPMLSMVSVTYVTYNDMQQLSKDYKDEIGVIREARWVFISSILNENLDKAKLQADSVKDKIEYNLLMEYSGDMGRLKRDLDSTESDNAAFKIMNEGIHGKYLNVDNDNNDMFVATLQGVLVDNSLNCSINKTSRVWQSEIPQHFNPALATNSIRLVSQQSKEMVYWEYTIHPDSKHIMLEYPSLVNLKKVYMAEGVAGLSSYEFLVPSYIRSNRDIFNTPDVTMRGIKNDNYKLIVVQGFNLVDALNKNYLDKLSYFSHLEQLVDITNTAKKSQKLIELFLILAVLISSFIGISLTVRTLIKWGGDDANCRY